MSSIVQMLREFRDLRSRIKNLKATAETTQPRIVELMRCVDPENRGIVIGASTAAYVQQNSPPVGWDVESVSSYLHRRPKLRESVSSMQVDFVKFGQAVEDGRIPARSAAKLLTVGKTPVPFVRFDPPHPNSLREV